MSQLSFFGAPPPKPPADLPPAAVAILAAARSLAFTTRVTRGCWGVAVGVKRRWTLRWDRCCALGAYLVAVEAVAGPSEQSPRATVTRLLGLTHDQVTAFTRGFDGLPGDGSEWYRYGARVAEEVITP